jgi:hypothetical protein
MTLFNMNNVIYISSLNKLIVDSNGEHAIIFTCRLLVTTSISTHLYICHYEKKKRIMLTYFTNTQYSIDLLHLHDRLFKFIVTTSQLIRFTSSFVNIRIALSVCKSIETISVVCLLY